MNLYSTTSAVHVMKPTFCLTASISDLTASISLIASAYSSLYLWRDRGHYEYRGHKWKASSGNNALTVRRQTPSPLYLTRASPMERPYRVDYTLFVSKADMVWISSKDHICSGRPCAQNKLQRVKHQHDAALTCTRHTRLSAMKAWVVTGT